MNKYFVLTTLVAISSSLQANDFISDSSAKLTLRNFYYDRDYRDGSGQSQAQEWAQGFIFNYASGYTEGTIGLGLNAVGMLGVKLDSGPGRTGTGILAYNASTHEVADDYSKFGLAAKARYSKTEVQLGTLQPLMPVLLANTMRLFPPLLRGGYLTSKEMDGLTLHVAHLDRIKYRDSTDFEPMAIANPNRRFKAGATSNDLNIVGADYNWSKTLTTRYYHATLNDLYEQDYIDLVHFLDLGHSRLKTDLRYFNSRENGNEKAGAVDNQTLSSMFTWLAGAHSLGVGYMQLTGDTALPYVSGTSVNVNTEGALVSEFVNPNERVMQIRYDYDFAALGIPGLRGMWRYIKGDHIELPSDAVGSKERERGIELSYVIQSGTFKDVAFRIRSADYNSDFARNVGELRVNVDYSVQLW